MGGTYAYTHTDTNICKLTRISLYHKWEKMAKHSQFQPYKVFHENIFVVPWSAALII